LHSILVMKIMVITDLQFALQIYIHLVFFTILFRRNYHRPCNNIVILFSTLSTIKFRRDETSFIRSRKIAKNIQFHIQHRNKVNRGKFRTSI
jgi:hypothetical protein